MVRQRNSGRKMTALFSQVEKVSTGKTQNYVMDLRVHSPNSLGYRGIDGLDTAPALVRLAQVKGIDLLGVTDFYCGKFVDRVRSAAQNTTITVIPGVDMRCTVGSCNDAEMSCLFPETFASEDIQVLLRDLGIPEECSGDSSFRVGHSLEELLQKVEGVGGVMLPSRMDRTPSRRKVIPRLVEEFGFRTFDLAHADSAVYFEQTWPQIEFHLFSFSNANALAQVGSRIARVPLDNPGFSSLKQFLMRAEARS
jgi:hypothetical protein